jgi:hypothetical protein
METDTIIKEELLKQVQDNLKEMADRQEELHHFNNLVEVHKEEILAFLKAKYPEEFI